MPVNFRQHNRPRPVVTRHEFTDPANPGVPVILWLGPLDDMEVDRADEVGVELARKYVYGGWNDGDRFEKDPCPLFPIDGRAITVSAQGCRAAARIVAMQREAEQHPEDTYTPEQLFDMSVTFPSAWAELQRVAMGYLSGEGWQGKDLRAGMEKASDRPLQQENDTPT